MSGQDRRDDSADDELARVRARLERLVAVRRQGGFTVREQVEYEQLTRRETQLLATVRRDPCRSD